MGSLYAPDYNSKLLFMAEAGNAWSEDYSATVAPKNGDKLYLGIIPAGVRVYEVRLKHGAAGASTTGKLGYEPFDGDAPSADDDYWLAAATSLATAGVERSEASAITFDRPVKLVLTAGGADHASGAYEVVIVGKIVGAP